MRRSSSCTACRPSTTPRPCSASRSPTPTASATASKSPTRFSRANGTSPSNRPRTGCTRSRRSWSPRWGTDMLVVVALGGNALLKRGEPMTAENQRRNVRIAAQSLAPVAAEHDLVVGHGNGPQVGLLALQGAAYAKVETYPLDALGAQTEGMIGYLIEQELGNLVPYEQHIATVLTMIEVDPKDPAFHKPGKPIGPVYTREQAD